MRREDPLPSVSPTLYVLAGLPGSGKTARARALERVGVVRLSPDDWMFPLFGDVDASRERDVVEGQLISLACRLLAIQVSVALDFGVWTRDERCALRELANASGATFQLIYLPVDAQEQRRRLARRAEAGECVFTFTDEDLERYRSSFEEPTAAELEGRASVAPSPFEGWGAWAARRWPGVRWPET